MVATGSANITILQNKIIDFGKYAGESVARLGQAFHDFLPVIKTVGAAFAVLFTIAKIQAGVTAMIKILGAVTKAMKALRIVAISTAIAEAFVLNPLGGVAVAAGIIAAIVAVGVAVDGLDAKFSTLGQKSIDFFAQTDGLKFGERFDLTKYKKLQAEAKKQAALDKKNAEALRKAEAAAAAERARQAKLEAAAKLKSDKLAKASAMFDLDKIQVAAALKGKITDEEKLRLQLQQAILNENDELADKLQQKLEASQIATAKLTAQIIGIKPGVNPFDAWLDTLNGIALTLAQIAKMPTSSVGGTAKINIPPTGEGSVTISEIPKIIDVPKIIDILKPEEPYVSMPQEPVYSSGTYGNTGGFGFSLPSYLQNTIPQVTVNVEAGTLVMQDDLVTLINDAVIAANKNGYTQVPNGAILP